MASNQRLDQIVAAARNAAEERERGYRARALAMYPHVCGRCGRDFDRHNLHELTVHHRDHDHDNNPPDGSNWELLCIYCHDNEHQRHEALLLERAEGQTRAATYNPFADLKGRMNRKHS